MITALLVYRDGSINFKPLPGPQHTVSLPIRKPLRTADMVSDEEPTISLIRFMSRGKAGPYQVYEEVAIV